MFSKDITRALVFNRFLAEKRSFFSLFRVGLSRMKLEEKKLVRKAENFKQQKKSKFQKFSLSSGPNLFESFRRLAPLT